MPNAGVLVAAPKAGVELLKPKPPALLAAPNSEPVLVPNAGVLAAPNEPNAGVLAANAGALAPKGLLEAPNAGAG